MVDLERYQTDGRDSSRRAQRPAGISGSTAREISASAEAAIREGRLDTGQALPTVRALAGALGTSPATVSSAYRILQERGLVIADGRRGTRVAPRPPVRIPERPRRPELAVPGARQLRDLMFGLPDPALLPAVAPALSRIAFHQEPRSCSPATALADPKLLALAAAALRADGLATDAIAVTSGALDGVERVLQAHLRPGDRVVIEDPAYSAIRDLLLALGLVAVPVPVDALGFKPGAFAASLARGAEAIVVVPRAQNPLGAALDATRAGELRDALAGYPHVLLVEDDHAGLVSGAPFMTLVSAQSRRWSVIRSVTKVLHPDLRVAIVAGDEITIARVEGRQELGPRWVSHLLQAIVAELLSEPGFRQTAARARDAYRDRRAALMDALAARGLESCGRSGLNVWVPVREEAPVVGALHDAGWLVAAGERFRINAPPGIRVTVATLGEEEAEEIASVIAAVEHARAPRRAY